MFLSPDGEKFTFIGVDAQVIVDGARSSFRKLWGSASPIGSTSASSAGMSGGPGGG
jgi:hypothetical protein